MFNPRHGRNFDSTVTDDAAAGFMPAGGQRVSRPLAFSRFVAESARADLRELDRLQAAAGNVRGVIAGGQTVTAAGRTCARRPTAEGVGAAVEHRGVDWDRAAAGVAGKRGGAGGDGKGESSGICDLGLGLCGRAAERGCRSGSCRTGRLGSTNRIKAGDLNLAAPAAGRAAHALATDHLDARRCGAMIDVPRAAAARTHGLHRWPQGNLLGLPAAGVEHACSLANGEQKVNCD